MALTWRSRTFPIETLPYDTFSPHQDIISERLNTLRRLSEMKSGILVVPVSTLMHRLLLANIFRHTAWLLK